jgi:tetratricopeptide (TPR) repeat protein
MPGRILVTAVLTVACLSAPSRADERFLDFIQSLHENGYHDVAAEYVEQIRRRPNAPPEIKAIADFLIGKSLLGGAERVTDVRHRDEQLDRARTHFERFVREQPGDEHVPEAQMDLAQILVARGRLALLQADNPNNEARRGEFQGQARGHFDAARKSFADARDRFSAALKSFPAFIPETDKKQREAKSQARINLMQAMLNLGLVEYEFAQSYNKDSPDFKKTLTDAISLFEGVHTEFRTLLGGQYARLWQGKCYEELGELKKAEGRYDALLQHEDTSAAMKALQRHAQFFKVIILNKQGDHALAAELAKNWLQVNGRERRSEVGIGVQFEQAQALITMSSTLPAKGSERQRMLTQAMDNLSEVARFDTLYKQPAILLQQKYKGLIGSGVAAVMTYERAVAAATAATERNAWPEAADYYAQALRLAKDNLDSEELALTRYMLSFCYFQTKNYLEAAVLGEYVSRHQPQASRAAKAGHVAIEALARAFNDLTARGEPTDFEEDRMVRLGEYLIATWPTTGEADAARFILADLTAARGRHADAGALFETVNPNSPDYARALSRAGDAFWAAYVEGVTKPTEQQPSDQLAAWLRRARDNLAKSAATQAKLVKPDAAVPVEFAATQIRLAEVSIEAGDPAEAVKIVSELVPKFALQKDLEPLHVRALVSLLRGQIMTGDLKAAQITMQEIEGTGKDLAQITRVYLELGRQLQQEMERIKSRKDAAAEKRMRDNYVAFLTQMSARREGQTLLTLRWTGEAFFGLEMYEQSAERFREIVNRAANEPGFLDRSKPEYQAALVPVKLRLVASLRKLQRYRDAWDLIKPLAKEQNPGDDPLHKGVVLNYDIISERGLVMQEYGTREPTMLKTAIEHWAYWAGQLERLTPRPPQYFEYRASLVRCLIDRAKHPADSKDRTERLRQAEQQLLFLTRTMPTLGGATYKTQFQQLQAELEKELGRPLGSTQSAGKAAGK